MKTAIIIADGVKQVMFTPENETEKQALLMFTPSDKIELAVKTGSFGSSKLQPFSANVSMCKGDYLRVFTEENSIMLILTPKEKPAVNDTPAGN